MDDPRQDPTSEPHLLGGNIELSGFRALDGGSMIVLKKIIGNYARQFADNHQSERLNLHLTYGGDTYTLTGAVRVKGRAITATHADKNVFFVVDSVLKKLEIQLRTAQQDL